MTEAARKIENTEVQTQDQEIDELDAFLAEMEDQDDAPEVSVMSDKEAEEVAAEAQLKAARESAYEEQDKESTSVPDEEEIKAATANKGAKAAKTAKAKTAKAPSGATVEQALRAKMGDDVYKVVVNEFSEADLDDSALKTVVDARLAEFEDCAKKVREKIVNFYSAVAGKAKMSTYTIDALKLLKDKGEVTTADIRNVYLDHPYSPGTASAQSSQMMQLLPAVGVAKRSGNTITLNEESAAMGILEAQL